MLLGVSLLMLSHLTSCAPFIQHHRQHTLDKLHEDYCNLSWEGNQTCRDIPGSLVWLEQCEHVCSYFMQEANSKLFGCYITFKCLSTD